MNILIFNLNSIKYDYLSLIYITTSKMKAVIHLNSVTFGLFAGLAIIQPHKIQSQSSKRFF
jgi:uncharacterized membrane protein YcgQ (UPF0703/DUF1980 family)